MLQSAALLEVAKAAKEKGMNVWCYTGFTLEALLKEKRPDRMALLEAVDVLVDGPYLAHERSIDLLYCGSKNQRLIDMNKTRETGETVLFEPEIW
jgi:anaerobic ribonucleoside-triphosphate reductase activating protein